MTWLNALRTCTLTALVSLAMACATYHYVTDPQTGNVYYTEDLDHRSSGAVEFTDGKTGARVSLPSSEVQEINEEEYLANTPIEK